MDTFLTETDISKYCLLGCERRLAQERGAELGNQPSDRLVDRLTSRLELPATSHHVQASRIVVVGVIDIWWCSKVSDGQGERTADSTVEPFCCMVTKMYDCCGDKKPQSIAKHEDLVPRNRTDTQETGSAP